MTDQDDRDAGSAVDVVVKPDPTDELSENGRADDTTGDDAQPEPTGSASGRRISISLRAAVVTVVILAFAAGCGVFAWLYVGSNRKLDALERSEAQGHRAEEVAIDYAVSAAEMNYQDFDGWKLKLVDGTSPELKDKLGQAADSMQQILAPLQWTSSARPLAAKVRSDVDGVYTVDAFVSVLTKTMQAPDGLQSTATYSITLDSRNNWQITDVGGIDSALGK